MFATLDFCKNLIMHHAEKNKNVIYRLGRSVLKNTLSRSQKRPSAFGLGPFLRPRQNIFPVRTSHPVNNIYIFLYFSLFVRSLSIQLVEILIIQHLSKPLILVSSIGKKDNFMQMFSNMTMHENSMYTFRFNFVSYPVSVIFCD